MEEPEVIRLLKKSFSEDEWRYLARNSAFKTLLEASDGTPDFERLVHSGELLLRQKNELGLQ